VHLAYPPHPPARHLSNLSLLRISAFPLVVLGIATAEDEPAEGYNVNDDDEGDIAGSSKASAMAEIGGGLEGSFGETLAGLFPPTSPFPLVKRLIVVPKDTPAPDSSHSSPKKNGDGARGAATSGYSKGKAGVEVVHAPTEGVEGWLGRLLGEVVGDVLGELGELVGGPLSPMSISILTLGNCIGNSSRPQDALIDIATLAHVHASSSAPRNPFPGPVNVIYTHAGTSSRSLYHTCVHLQLTICRHTIYPERPRYISHACPHARWSTHFCRSAIFASDSDERHRSHSSAGTPIGIIQSFPPVYCAHEPIYPFFVLGIACLNGKCRRDTAASQHWHKVHIGTTQWPRRRSAAEATRRHVSFGGHVLRRHQVF